MPQIHKLPKELISKIAAGEVVERPVNVVKELVENAIDAEATEIKVYLAEGGSKEITVVDNGLGMGKEDLERSFERHTTSKIASLGDLEGIASLGFRGEALFSISSVSHLEIASRPKDSEEGHQIKVQDGRIVESGSVGMPVGTRVNVRDLFYNVPARRKYLKEAAVESKKVLDLLVEFGMAAENIDIRLYHNEKESLHVVSTTDKSARARNLFSESLYKNLLPIESGASDIELSGFVSKPEASRKSKTKQHLFINGRIIKNGFISDTVRAAYGNLLEARRNPPYILHLTMPASALDVNVHPKKEKAKFIDETTLRDFVFTAVKTALESQDLTEIKHGYSGLGKELSPVFEELKSSTGKVKDSDLDTGEILQVHDLYLLKETPEGLLVVDQHAAHERILFEYMSQNLKEKASAETIKLDDPVELKLDASDFALLENNLDSLKRLGFTVKKENNSVQIKEIPTVFEGRNLEKLILNFLDDLQSGNNPNNIDDHTEMALSYLVCRGAIKEGDKLDIQQRRWLLNQLEETKSNYTCPHGRPAKVLIPTKELGNWFKR